MGTTLTGTTPQDTYDSLIKVTDNGPLSGTAKYLSDGLGNDSGLALSTGNIGVGYTSPTQKLSVAGNVKIAGAQAGNVAKLNLTRTDFSWLISNETDLRFYTQAGDTDSPSTLNVAFATSGNVGIGTSAPADKLHVAFDSDFSLRIDGAGDIKQYRGDGSTGGLNLETFLTSGSWGTNGGFVAISPRGTERVRVTADGLTFNGDTAAANALDDYEEGTFNFGISFGGGSTGITYAYRSGTYTKIGRQVTVNGLIALTNKGSDTGTATITGLPFTIANTIANYGGASLYFYNISFANQFQGHGTINATTVDLREITEAGVVSNLTDANFLNNSEIIISFTYFV